MMAVLCAVLEANMHILWGGYYFSHSIIHLWNMFINMAMFIIVAFLIYSLKSAYTNEKNLARKDFLTGVSNSQAFAEIAHREVERAKRYGNRLSLAYIDCDNFKTVNDTLGHET